MKAEELKPCPFCGGAAEFKPYSRNGLILRCEKCHLGYRQKVLKFSLEWLQEKMTETWNKRVAP
jgi:hypothetical protein